MIFFGIVAFRQNVIQLLRLSINISHNVGLPEEQLHLISEEIVMPVLKHQNLGRSGLIIMVAPMPDIRPVRMPNVMITETVMTSCCL